VGSCPVPVRYSQETMDAAADELVRLPADSTVALMMVHYFGLRAQALACQEARADG
jgi:hypothetical protein